jgi:glycosyltransferase involved in cell wall biosynthesis
MRELLSAHGLDPRKLYVAENWADGSLIRPSEIPPCPPLIIRYAGNLGLAHETDTIAQVMLRLKHNKDFRFVFAGGGAREPELEAFCKANQIESVDFRPYMDRNAFGEGLASCHVGLVTLRAACVGTVVPSKVYSLLAAGRPFLYIGPQSGTAARIAAEGCGWQHEPGDVDGIVSLLHALRADVTIVRAAGLQARRIFEARYDRAQGSRRVADILTEQDALAKPLQQINPEPAND